MRITVFFVTLYVAITVLVAAPASSPGSDGVVLAASGFYPDIPVG